MKKYVANFFPLWRGVDPGEAGGRGVYLYNLYNFNSGS